MHKNVQQSLCLAFLRFSKHQINYFLINGFPSLPLYVNRVIWWNHINTAEHLLGFDCVLLKADLCKNQTSSITCTFYFTLQKTKRKTLATHRHEWINAHVDKWDRCTRDFNIFTHVHTGLCTEDTQYVTYVQRTHKDSTTQSIPTRYTSTEDETGNGLFWNNGMDLWQPGEQHDQHVHQKQTTLIQILP